MCISNAKTITCNLTIVPLAGMLLFTQFVSLQHRKKMWLQQKLEETSVPDPTIPDGHIIMPTKDKVHTLQALQQGSSFKKNNVE